MKKLILFFLVMANLLTAAQPTHRLLVGTYTHTGSRGIYTYSFNGKTGEATLLGTAAATNPSFLAIAPGGKQVYSVSETGEKEGGGKVMAFALDKDAGTLSPLNEQSSGGHHPCYIAVDKTGKWVAVGNYSSGTVALLPAGADGRLGEAVSIIRHEGGGPNKDRQEGPHVHATVFSPDNKLLLVTDLGTDKIYLYAFDEAKGSLQPSPAQPFVKVQEGSGPRHLAFHPNGKWVYLIQELSGTVTTFRYQNGMLQQEGVVSLLPAEHTGGGTSADIHVSPDGAFLYASNRKPTNTIAIFRVDGESGKLQLVGQQQTGGVAPRNFNFDPSGNFLLAANQDSDTIAVFRIDRRTGLLTETGIKIRVPRPVCIQWAN